MPTLTIIRGLPGSGKSTYAQKHFPQEPLYEADMFFGPEYKFNPDLLHKAHTWCYLSVYKSLYAGNHTVVANTFVTHKELQKYLDLVEEIPNLNIEVVEMYTQHGSIHNVPNKVIERMKSNWVYFNHPTIQVTHVTHSDQTIN